MPDISQPHKKAGVAAAGTEKLDMRLGRSREQAHLTANTLIATCFPA